MENIEVSETKTWRSDLGCKFKLPPLLTTLKELRLLIKLSDTVYGTVSFVWFTGKERNQEKSAYGIPNESLHLKP